MMSEHKWTLSEGSGVYCVTHHDRACMMSNAEAIVILNEHAQLKAELVLYKKITTMPKLLWDLQAENERLKTDLEWWKGLAGQLEMEVREDALKEKP